MAEMNAAAPFALGRPDPEFDFAIILARHGLLRGGGAGETSGGKQEPKPDPAHHDQPATNHAALPHLAKMNAAMMLQAAGTTAKASSMPNMA